MHISSLPGAYGIGALGKEAHAFVDFLAKAGQTYWQTLPVCPAGEGNSPYSSFSTFAGNPYFIDLDTLCEEGLLFSEELQRERRELDESQVDYDWLHANRRELLFAAYQRFKRKNQDDYEAFCEEHIDWLDEYALYMAIKEASGDAPWMEWETKYKFREPDAMDAFRHENTETVHFWKTVQYFFFQQWSELKCYANTQGVRIIGDLPIYVAMDSADVWSKPEEFLLDENLYPASVSGCPPDAFSITGQLWGNPLYRWDLMKQQQYEWWVRRFYHLKELFDVTRIDHFRGFDSYYAIPADHKDAKKGDWRPGPGLDLFRVAEEKLGKMNIIAEDLGFLTASVRKLVLDSGFPGMKVLQFAFDSRESNDYLPHNYPAHCVVYTGTHDNDTTLGWLKMARPDDVDYAVEYLRLNQQEGYHWGMIKSVWASVADTSIVPMQDLLGLGNEARMNTPSTEEGNWRWRMKPGAADDALAEKMLHLMEVYHRIPHDE